MVSISIICTESTECWQRGRRALLSRRVSWMDMDVLGKAGMLDIAHSTGIRQGKTRPRGEYEHVECAPYHAQSAKARPGLTASESTRFRRCLQSELLHRWTRPRFTFLRPPEHSMGFRALLTDCGCAAHRSLAQLHFPSPLLLSSQEKGCPCVGGGSSCHVPLPSPAGNLCFF